MTATNEEPEVKLLKPSQVRASELQPRKHFVANGEMESSVREHGIIQPLVVRRTGGVRNGGIEFELICGERRWRAAVVLALESVPVIVREMDDRHVLEMQLSENLQREALNPMEEAMAYRLLEDMGESREKIAKAVGKPLDHVNETMVLCRLAGSDVAVAIEQGKIKARHGRVLAGVPSAMMRSELLLMLMDDGYPALKTVAELDNYVRLHCARDLRAAAFSREDSDLVPVEMEDGERKWGGACTDCPFAVLPDGAPKTSKARLCTNLECWQAKEIATHERWRSSFAKATEDDHGRLPVTLSHAENAALWKEGTQLDSLSGYVDLDELPAERELKHDAGLGDIWLNLVRGQQIEMTLARDPRGVERTLVRHDAAKKAAHLNGHKIFRDSPTEDRLDQEQSVTGAERAPRNEEDKKKEAAERKRAAQRLLEKQQKKIEKIVAAAESSFLRGHLNIPQKQFWGVLAGAMLDIAGAADVLNMVIARRGAIDPRKAHELGLGERLGLVIECAIALTGDTDPWATMFRLCQPRADKEL